MYHRLHLSALKLRSLEGVNVSDYRRISANVIGKNELPLTEVSAGPL